MDDRLRANKHHSIARNEHIFVARGVALVQTQVAAMKPAQWPALAAVVAVMSCAAASAADDPVAAWGGVHLLRDRFKVEPCMVTGPSTDNQVGVTASYGLTAAGQAAPTLQPTSPMSAQPNLQ